MNNLSVFKLYSKYCVIFFLKLKAIEIESIRGTSQQKWWRLLVLLILRIMMCSLNVISSHIASNSSITLKIGNQLEFLKVNTDCVRISISFYLSFSQLSIQKRKKLRLSYQAVRKICRKMTLAEKKRRNDSAFFCVRRKFCT